MEVLETRQKLECMLFLTLSVVNKSEIPKKLLNGARICHFFFHSIACLFSETDDPCMSRISR